MGYKHSYLLLTPLINTHHTSKKDRQGLSAGFHFAVKGLEVRASKARDLGFGARDLS